VDEAASELKYRRRRKLRSTPPPTPRQGEPAAHPWHQRRGV